ncbi:hypothetical protein ACFV0O_27360 [Kitasatospora sp. NPDC059577]|uniref:hypothetical protein n=1 Tax=Kitasatospora sp. NPDC059577 TaxID=3346873 RepID=UPI00369B13FE
MEIEELTAGELLEPDPAETSRLRLTDTGRGLHERTTAEISGITDRLYAGAPAEDLAVAGRVPRAACRP